MPLFTPYFSLDSSAFRVGNGGRLRCRMGASGIGIYVMLLSHLRDCRDCRAPLDYDMLAFDLHEDAAAVRRVVEDFGLFDIDRSSGTFTSSVLTTVRGMLSDDGAAAVGGTVRTVRQRRVRSAGETYRRAVRRLAEDNALPPAEEEAPAEGDAEPAEEVPTSSPNAITPAEGEDQPAEEADATGDSAPTSIAAEGTPAEVKHESADAESTPAEVEDQPAEKEDATAAIADARSPRTEEKRKEQNKKPHTPIVPFPQSGKGTRASHPAAAVVGEREEGAASAEGDEESVVGSPRFVSSAAVDADAPPCAAAPTVLGAHAQTLDPHPSPDTAKADTSAENGKTSAEKTKTSVPNSQPNTLITSEAPAHPQTDTAKADTSVPNAQANPENGKTSTENKEMSMPNAQSNTLTASEETAHPQTDTAKTDTSVPNAKVNTANGRTSVPNGESSTEKGRTNLPNSQSNTLTASEEPAHPQTLDPHPSPDTANGRTSMPNSQTDTAKADTSVPNSHPNTLTTSEKGDESGSDEEGAGEPFVPPTANEVRRFAEALRHPEFDAEWFVAYYTERHWRRHNGRPVVSWQTTARYWLDHPLRVARHLLGHRPAASPVSVGVSGPSAVVVPAACPAAAKPVAGSASFPSTGTYPVGTGGLSPRASASSPHSGTPHVGSLSLPAPTPLQQSRLSDLKGMVLHLFADAPTAAPTSATAAPDLSSAAADVSASVPTPATAASPSVRPARILSPAEAAQVIAQQTLAAAEAEVVPRVGERRATDSEEEARIGEISPTDAAKAIDAQVLSPADAKEYVRSCDDSTADAVKAVDAQALSPADAKEYVRACDDSTDEDGEEARIGEISPTDAAKAVDAQVLSPADAKEYVRSCDDSTDEDGEEARVGDISPTDAAKAVDAQAFSTTDTEESVRACDDSTDEDEEKVDTQAFSIPDAAKGIDAQALSPADAAKDIDAQAFSTTDAEEKVDAQAFSTTDAAKDIDAQALSTADAEEKVDVQAFSTTDNAKGIDTQAFSADKGRWGVRSPRGPDPPTGDGHDSTDTGNHFADTGNDFADAGNDFADAENHFTAQPSNFSADRHPPAAVGTALAADPPISPADECRPLRPLTEKHPYLNPSFHESHPLLRLHPPSFGGFGRTFRVQSVQPPFGRSFLGRFVDIRPACTVGSRPLRPRLARCRPARGRCRPEHPDRECTNAANAAERSANAVSTPTDEPEHGTDGRKRHDSAPERSANAISPLADAHEHDAQCAKNADFIDADPVRGHQTERNEPEYPADGRKRHDSALEHPANAAERSANTISPLADEPEHGAQRSKNADFIDVDPAHGHKIEHNESEHLADAEKRGTDGRKRHDSAPERSADAGEHADCGRKRHDLAPEHTAYDLDAGQRVLRSAAHRRAVRAEREACCGALRHLAHCCVAF